MSENTIEEQTLRLLKSFTNIDDPVTREVIITIAKFAESRARARAGAFGHGRPHVRPAEIG